MVTSGLVEDGVIIGIWLACATGAALSQDKTGGQPEREYDVVLTDDLAIDKAETEALPSKNTGQRNAAP